ncbi:hypothetical protein EIP86_008358 [Pleurotus ostreatoroseus]|nr:hypothetical protein EIP86_008358 [Pleurotus ostreatoroseus]
MATVPLVEDQVARDESKDQGMLVTVDNALLDDELLAATMIPLLQQNQATRATMMGFILTTIVHRIPRLRSPTGGYYQTADFKRMSTRTWNVFVDLIITIIGSDPLDDVSASDSEWLQGTLAVLNSCPEGYPFSPTAASVLARTTQSLYKSIALQRAGSPSHPFRDVWAACRRVIPAKSFKTVAVMSDLLSSQYCHDQCHHDGLFDIVRSHHAAVSGDTHAICSILVKTMQSNLDTRRPHSSNSDQDDVAQIALTLSFAWLTEKALIQHTMVERIVQSLYTALPDSPDFYSIILHPLMLRIPKLRRGTEGYQRVDLSSFNLRRDTWDFYMRLVQYASVSLSNNTLSSTGAQRGWIEGTVAILQSCSDHYPLTTSVALVYEERFKKLFFESMALTFESLRFKGIWSIIMRTFGPDALSCRTDFIYQLLQTTHCKDCTDQQHAGLLELLSHHIQTLQPDIKDICDALDQQFMKDEINTIRWTRDLEEALLVFIACLGKNNPLFNLQVLEYGKNLNAFLSETTKYPAVIEPMLNAFARRVPAFRIRIEGYSKERQSIDLYRTVVNLTGLSRHTWDLYLEILSRPFNVVALRRSRPDLLEGILALLNSRSADYPLTDAAKHARDLLSGTFLQSMREFVQIQSKGHDIPDVLFSCSRILVQDDLNDPSAFLFDLLVSHHCRNESSPCHHQDVYATIEAHCSPRTRLGIARFLTDHIRQSYPRAPSGEWQTNTLASLALLCQMMRHLKKSDLNDYDKPCSLVSILLRQSVITLPSFTTTAVESLLQVPDAWIRIRNFKNTPSTGRQIQLQNLAYLLKRYSSGDVSDSVDIHILSCCETSLEALHTALQEIPIVIQEDAGLWEDFMKQMASALNVFLDRNGGSSKIYSESAIRCLGTCTSLLLQTRNSGRMLGMSGLVSALHDYLILPYDDLRCLRDIVSDEPRTQSILGRHPLPPWPEVSEEADDRASAWIEDDDDSSFYF